MLIFHSIVFTIMEPTLPLRLQDVYGFGSLQVGIVFVATVVPSLFCEYTISSDSFAIIFLFFSNCLATPLSGWISDKTGVEWVTVCCMVLSAPWWIIMTIRGPLALLVTSLALGCELIAPQKTAVSYSLRFQISSYQLSSLLSPQTWPPPQES
jgi:DHA1 family solute carrier family 18 vesicular amine transporter 1/2